MRKRHKKYLSIGSFVVNVVAAVGASVATVYALRDNNIRAGELYLALQRADESGVGISDALQSLQVHVASHMNSSPLPQLGDNAPVQLTKSYERAKAAELVRASSERERVNAEAIAYCEGLFSRSSLVTRTQCVADYGTAHPVTPEQVIVADLYRYDFISPNWTPDKAGWLLVVSAVLIFTLILQFLAKLVTNILVKE